MGCISFEKNIKAPTYVPLYKAQVMAISILTRPKTHWKLNSVPYVRVDYPISAAVCKDESTLETGIIRWVV